MHVVAIHVETLLPFHTVRSVLYKRLLRRIEFCAMCTCCNERH